MKFDVSGSKTEYFTVQVSGHDLADKLFRELRAKIRPECTKKYDDWYINTDGVIVGITEYNGRGSDTETKLELAMGRLARQLEAIETVCKLLKE